MEQESVHDVCEHVIVGCQRLLKHVLLAHADSVVQNGTVSRCRILAGRASRLVSLPRGAVRRPCTRN